jgi:hypothetical protein
VVNLNQTRKDFPSAHFMGGWKGPIAGLDLLENIKSLDSAGNKPRIGQPIAYSMYRLRYRVILQVHMYKTAVFHLLTEQSLVFQ